MSGKLDELIESVFDQDYSEVVKAENFQEIDAWDSLMYVNLVVSIEKAFKIVLDKDEIQILTSVANIESILNKRGIDANA